MILAYYLAMTFPSAAAVAAGFDVEAAAAAAAAAAAGTMKVRQMLNLLRTSTYVHVDWDNLRIRG